MSDATVQFIDLAAQQSRIRGRIDAAIARVLDHGKYIMGPEVALLEGQLAEFCGAKHAIGCSNGTDALMLCLMAKGVRTGDAVFCPSFTFAATAEAIACLGATAVFVDIDLETYNMDPNSLRTALAEARKGDLRPVGVIAVDLFGQPADYEAIEAVVAEEELWLMCDAAQSFGARYHDRPVGTLGDMTTTSFFPAKPLGCYGDGGAIFVDDDSLADILRSLIVHGKGREKYDNVRIGMNGRLDTLQAAILIEKLAIFADEIKLRDVVAARYNEAFSDALITPKLLDGVTSVWAQYTLRAPGLERASVQNALKERGVPTAVYYPKPLHKQPAYKHFATAGNGLPNSDIAAREVFSLPMHPYLGEAEQNSIIDNVKMVIGNN